MKDAEEGGADPTIWRFVAFASGYAALHVLVYRLGRSALLDIDQSIDRRLLLLFAAVSLVLPTLGCAQEAMLAFAPRKWSPLSTWRHSTIRAIDRAIAHSVILASICLAGAFGLTLMNAAVPRGLESAAAQASVLLSLIGALAVVAASIGFVATSLRRLRLAAAAKAAAPAMKEDAAAARQGSTHP